MLRRALLLTVLSAFAVAAREARADGAAPAPGAPPPAPVQTPAAPPQAPADAVVADVPCGCCPPRSPCRPARLELQGHGSLLTAGPEGLASVDSGGPGQVRWDPLDYDVTWGGRVAFTVPWSGWDVRVAGTWWGRWDDAGQQVGTLASTTTPGAAPVVNGPFPVRLESEAWLADVALTFSTPWYCSACFTSEWGVGLRYLRLDEEATIEFPFGAQPTPSRYESDIENGLLAAELVASATWRLNSCWDLLARGSVFAGWMHRSGEVSSVNVPLGLVNTTDEDDDLGFGGEVEVALRWNAGRSWSLSVGYGLLVLGNVTRAFESFDFANSATLDIGPVFTDDVILAHRLFLGVGIDF